jgi:hypothetical protein
MNIDSQFNHCIFLLIYFFLVLFMFVWGNLLWRGRVLPGWLGNCLSFVDEKSNNVFGFRSPLWIVPVARM